MSIINYTVFMLCSISFAVTLSTPLGNPHRSFRYKLSLKGPHLLDQSSHTLYDEGGDVHIQGQVPFWHYSGGK